MSTLDKKNPSYAPAYITGIYPQLAIRAKELGYALTLHGSIQRDLDVVAVPWIKESVDPIVLVTELCKIFDVNVNHPLNKPEIKPHGRLAYSIPLWWGAYIDLSVIPPREIKQFEFKL